MLLEVARKRVCVSVTCILASESIKCIYMYMYIYFQQNSYSAGLFEGQHDRGFESQEYVYNTRHKKLKKCLKDTWMPRYSRNWGSGFAQMCRRCAKC